MADRQDEKFSVTMSTGFGQHLRTLGGSIVFTTYQCGKVLFVGSKPDGRVSIFERSFPRAMGVAISDNQQSFCLATKDRIYEFDNLLNSGQTANGHDALYAPHQSWITGDIDIHDMAYGADGLPIFCATLFNCIGRAVRGFSFEPVWRPEFISSYAAEDRCHLNGFDVQDGAPRYVTCVGRSDNADGWRDLRRDGGLVLDVTNQNVVATGLSMPHSPRLHDGKLWLLNSGRGELGWVDLNSGSFTPVAFCPGFARGLKIIGDVALIGLSEPRSGKTFDGLPLQDALEEHGETARCGLLMVDLRSGKVLEWMKIKGVITELYDVNFLKRVHSGAFIGTTSEEIYRTISIKYD